MAGNIQPIFTRQANIQFSGILITAAADYSGQNVFNTVVFNADPVSGGYIQRLRFKAIGTNVTTVARIYINNGNGIANASSNVPQTLTGTPSATGGALLTQNLVAKVASVDSWGVPSAWSAESANVAVVSAGGVGSVAWNWNASGNSNTYLLAIGKTPGAEERYVTIIGANTYTQTAIPSPNATLSLIGGAGSGVTQANNSWLYGEISLPATTISATQSTQDVDYPMNFALPPGYRITVGLGTSVGAGWGVIAIGGSY